MSKPFRPRFFGPREPALRRNGKIRAREVRVVDESRQQLGVMSLNEALRLAQSRGLDLIEVAPTATPPVCRIIEYGKYQYEEAKRAKESQNKQPKNTMKELQLTPAIDPHDFGVKLNHAIEFLCDGMKVLVKLRFRGRQKAHKEIGFDVVNRFVTQAAAFGVPDAPPKLLGDRDLNVILRPLPKDKRPKTARDPRNAQVQPDSQPQPAPAPSTSENGT